MREVSLLMFFLSVTLAVSAQELKKFEHSHYVATKGEVVEYDTAMVMNIEEVRRQFEIEQRKDRLIDSLQNLVLRKEENVPAVADAPEQQLFDRIEKIEKTVDRIAEKKPHWTMNPLLWLSVGLIAGVYLVDPPN
ncbi:hypothetical protein [Nafulsella turpanensis]|uniref:hypothetical protein n=1 Tax=Nafulsella turpanensis TaxID=1265690 RepID=UPI00135F1808|nr:hypothetical protein [Nafulsella turpanensis]